MIKCPRCLKENAIQDPTLGILPGLNCQSETDVIEVSKIVRSGYSIFDGSNSPTMEDKCIGHIWRKRKDLPKDWVWCPKCKTEKHKDRE